MFYKADQINKKLICPNCKQFYSDPKVLPCGKTICNNCINRHLMKSIKQPSAEFVCILCSKAHKVPEGGFPTSEFILDLIKEQPQEVYRGKAVDKLKSHLREMKTLIDTLNHEFMNP